MRTRLFAAGVLSAVVLGLFVWFANVVIAHRAMAQDQGIAAEAAARVQAEALAERAREEAARAEAIARDAVAKEVAAKRSAAAAVNFLQNDDSLEANNAQTKRRLAERMEAMYDQQPLAEALAHLADKLDIEFHSQRGDIEAAGVSLDAPVSLRLKRVRGDMLLDLALRQVSPELGYVIRDGIVIVTTRDAVAGNQAVRVYNCRELLAAAKSWNPPPATAPIGGSGGGNLASPQPGAGPVNPGMGSGMGGGFGGFFPELPQTPVQQLQQVIRATIVPETWDINGGAGTIEEFGGMLVVNQSEAVHDRIEKLLQMLHEAAAKE
jgi:hypothetical protein